MTEGHRGGFWTTLPGLLTGSAALITALTGAAIFMSGNKPTSSPAPQAEFAKANSENVQPTPTEAVPAKVEATAPAAGEDAFAQNLKAEAALENAKMPQRIDPVTLRTRVSTYGRIFILDHDVSFRTEDNYAMRERLLNRFCISDSAPALAANPGYTVRMRYKFAGEPDPLVVDATAASCAGRS
jgi:hypothetical protein